MLCDVVHDALHSQLLYIQLCSGVQYAGGGGGTGQIRAGRVWFCI